MFEWDTRKAFENVQKHGVSFDEAATSFADGHALDGPDVKHSEQEARFLRLGRSAMNRVLMVAYTVRKSSDGEAIRIISARRASRKERDAYRAGSEN
ncbi:MAG: BrnT family toxin [Vicinamibacterales bacterium]